MSTVMADVLAAQALREYLLRTLPAKVDSINAERVAVLRAPRSGPYALPATAALVLGATVESGTTVPLTGGTMTASDVSDAINAAGIVGLTASVDGMDRLVVQSSVVPDGDTPSVVYLGPDNDAPGTNAAFGWQPGGYEEVRSALIAPDADAVCDGNPGLFDLGRCFWVVMGRRTTEPRENIRSDIHRVTMQLDIHATEPHSRQRAATEYIGQCCRAVREVLLEDRTLDGMVHLVEVPTLVQSGETYLFAGRESASPLVMVAPMTIRIHVFERS